MHLSNQCEEVILTIHINTRTSVKVSPSVCLCSAAPLSMLCHVDGSPRRHRRSSVCHTQHLHGLALRSPLPVPVQHGGVDPLPWGIYKHTQIHTCRDFKWSPKRSTLIVMHSQYRSLIWKASVSSSI